MKKDYLIFSIFAIIFLVLSVLSMKDNSYTHNEPIYVYAGYSYLTTGNSFNSGHPIFSHIIAAIPILFTDFSTPPIEEVGHPYVFSRSHLYYYGENDPDKISFLSRIPFILLSLLFAFYVFKWAKELYGYKAGIFALFLYLLSPSLLSQSSVAITDLPVAGFMFISCYYFWKLMKTPAKKYLLLCGLFFGFAISTKGTGVFLLPIFLLGLFLYKKKLWKQIIYYLFLISLIGFLIFNFIHIKEVHPIYTQEDPFYKNLPIFRTPERLDRELAPLIDNEFAVNAIKFGLTKIPVPGPHSWQAYLANFRHSSKGHQQYFFGEYRMHGRWDYYPTSYFIKTPIPLIILFFLSFIFRRKIKIKDGKGDIFITLSGFLFLFILSFLVKLNLGLRHSLFFFIVVILISSKAINLNFKRKHWRYIVLVLLILWYLIINLTIFLHYISYFNEMVGGPDEGYKYLIGNGLDWGQDLKRMGTYINDKGITDIKFKYAGFERPSYRNISYQELNCTPTTGLIFISATSLQGTFFFENKPANIDCFSWLRRLEPIGKIGYSIFIYNVTESDLSK